MISEMMSLTSNDERTGWLLVGHGTRDLAGQAEFRAVAVQVAAAAPEVVVEPCFLEMAEPTIAAAIDRCLTAGITRLCVAPLLLFTAGHAERDIPEAVAEALAARGAQLPVRQAPTLNCHPAIVELATRRFHESLANHGSLAAAATEVPPADTLLLVVGRGSLDATANAELARFARLRWERTPVGWLETCYLALTEPTLGSCR